MLVLVIFLETVHVVYNLVLELILTSIGATCIVLEFIPTCSQIIQEHDVIKRLIIFKTCPRTVCSNIFIIQFVPCLKGANSAG